MSLRGNLEVFSISDIIQLLSLSRKTGVLKITSSETGCVYFRQGECYFATSTKFKKPIGQRLIEAGLMSKNDLADALREQKEKSGNKRLGRILLDRGLVGAEPLEAFVSEQIWDAFMDILSWKNGEFEFKAGEVSTEADIGITLETWNKVATSVPSFENILKSEQWAKIKEAIPNLDMVFTLDQKRASDVAGINLEPDEWALVCMLDGRRTVAELMREYGKDNFRVGYVLYKLIKAGLIVQTGVNRKSPRPGQREEEMKPSRKLSPEANQERNMQKREEKSVAREPIQKEKTTVHQTVESRPGPPDRQKTRPNKNKTPKLATQVIEKPKRNESFKAAKNEIKNRDRNKDTGKKSEVKTDNETIAIDSVEIKPLGNLEVWMGKEKRFAELFIIKKGKKTSNVLRFPDGKHQFVHNRFSPEEKKAILEKMSLMKK